MPPHPPLSSTTVSSASCSRPQSATIMQPASKKTTSSAGAAPEVQPSASFPAAGSLRPVAESILPRSMPRRRLAARSKVASISVLVMAAHPERAATVFVAALRDEVEVVVGGVDEVDASRIGRVGVEHVAAVCLCEDAEAFTIRVPRSQRLVVEDGLVLPLRPERDVVVVVEVVLERRHPLEAPAHPLLVRRDLRQRRARDRDHRHVAGLQVENDRIEIVGPERADRAAGVVLRIEHEVVDEELATTVEELRQRLLPARAVEDVLLLDRLPRQGLPLLRQLVACTRELLLLRKELLASFDPLVVADDVHMPSGPRSSPGSSPRPAMTSRPR